MRNLFLFFLLFSSIALADFNTGPADSVFRVPHSGTNRLSAGSMDLSKSAAVGTSVLGLANGGTGVSRVSVFNVLAYGADPTGVADSTTALQNCVTAAQNAGGICYIAPSSAGYRITNTITVGNDVAIAGDTMTASSSAVNGATIFFSGTNAVPMFIVDDNAGSFRMSNLSLKNTGSATEAIQINRVNTLLENISSNSGTGFSTAIVSTYRATGYTYHVTINNVFFVNQSITSQTPVAIKYGGGHTMTVNNSMFSGFPTAAIQLVAAGNGAGGIEGASITNSHIEAFCGDDVGYPGSHNAVGISVAGPLYGLNVTGSNFQMNGAQTACGAAQRAITLTAVNGANITGNHFLGGSAAAAISIATANAKGVWIAGNNFDQYGISSIEILSGSADYAIGQNSYSNGSVGPTTYNSALSATSALVTDANQKIISSGVSTTQLNYLSAATGTTGATNSNLVYSNGPTLTGTMGFGILQSNTANPNTSETIRLARTDAIGWRNQANNADIKLAVDSGNELAWTGSGFSATFVDIRQDQAATSTSYVRNMSASASACALLNIGSNADSIGAQACSTAQGANAYLFAGSSMVGGFHIRADAASGPGLDLSTNGNVRINASPAGVVTIGTTSTTSQHVFNTATAAAASCGSLAGAAGCITMTINGSTRNIPYY